MSVSYIRELTISSANVEPWDDNGQQQFGYVLELLEGVQKRYREVRTMLVLLPSLHFERPPQRHTHEVENDGVRQSRSNRHRLR